MPDGQKLRLQLSPSEFCFSGLRSVEFLMMVGSTFKLKLSLMSNSESDAST